MAPSLDSDSRSLRAPSSRQPVRPCLAASGVCEASLATSRPTITRSHGFTINGWSVVGRGVPCTQARASMPVTMPDIENCTALWSAHGDVYVCVRTQCVRGCIVLPPVLHCRQRCRMALTVLAIPSPRPPQQSSRKSSKPSSTRASRSASPTSLSSGPR